MSSKKINKSEKNSSIFEKIKNAKHVRSDFNGRSYSKYHSVYKELGIITVNPDNLYNIYKTSDEKISQMEKWIDNWKQLKKEVTQEVLSQFSKEELQEALNRK